MNTSSCLLFYTDHYNTNAKAFHLEELKKTQITRHKKKTQTLKQPKTYQECAVQCKHITPAADVMITLHCHWLLVSLRIKCKIYCHCFIHYAKYFSTHLQPLLYTASETFHSSPKPCLWTFRTKKENQKFQGQVPSPVLDPFSFQVVFVLVAFLS